jgi:nicotinate-nucleotide adenylyltransferase
MLDRATVTNDRFRVSDMELNRDGPSYTVDTVAEFRSTMSTTNDLFVIIGADAFCEIDTWKQYQRLLTLCDFIVLKRPGFDPVSAPVIRAAQLKADNGEPRQLHHPCGTSIHLVNVTQLDISSTLIRNMVTAGKSIRYLVPDQVVDYVAQNNLYAT